MKYMILQVVIASSLFSCAAPEITHPEEKIVYVEVEVERVAQENFRFDASKNTEKTNEQLFLGDEVTNNINFYMRGLMQDLVSNLQYVNERTPIAVTSFVFLDGDYQQASLLGNQMSESLMHEIHKVGIPVLDFKVTSYLKVTDQGDFILSRDYKELSANIPIKYIVTGNLVKHQGGYLVNARVVGLSSKAVVGSAQSFIPADVANALLKSTSQQEASLVPLTQ